MDILNPADLKSLIAQQGKWCVSLYIPTHRFGQEQQQDRVLLKNLLARAETNLLANGLRRPKVQKLMQPAEELLWDQNFWQHQSDGLAIFLSNDFSVMYRLPKNFEELLMISKSFHTKPLVPLLNRIGKFYVLFVNLKQIRLFQGTADNISEIRLKFPSSVDQAPWKDDSEQDSEDAKKNILRFFQSINKELDKLLEDKNLPMILAGVEHVIPIYREACTYDNLLEDSIFGSFDEQNLKSLHESARQIAVPVFEKNQKQAFQKFEELTGQGNALAVSDLATAVKAARFGQVETMFVPLDEQRWGRYDPETDSVILESEGEPETEDLFDLASAETILNSGQVFSVERDQLPGKGDVAAILRFPMSV